MAASIPAFWKASCHPLEKTVSTARERDAHGRESKYSSHLPIPDEARDM